MSLQLIDLEELDALVFDFDGVLTDNRVLIDQNGREIVCCSRGDGLAFDVLRKLKKPVYILSTEENSVVTARGKKLKVSVIQGIEDKVTALEALAEKEHLSLEKVLYVGNDLNDYHAMSLCGYSACPSDSHYKIKQLSTTILTKSGGTGVIRELLEDVMKIDFLKILYTKL